MYTGEDADSRGAQGGAVQGGWTVRRLLRDAQNSTPRLKLATLLGFSDVGYALNTLLMVILGRFDYSQIKALRASPRWG